MVVVSKITTIGRAVPSDSVGYGVPAGTDGVGPAPPGGAVVATVVDVASGSVAAEVVVLASGSAAVDVVAADVDAVDGGEADTVVPDGDAPPVLAVLSVGPGSVVDGSSGGSTWTSGEVDSSAELMAVLRPKASELAGSLTLDGAPLAKRVEPLPSSFVVDR